MSQSRHGQKIPVVIPALPHAHALCQVHKVLDEIVMGGMVLETDIRTIVESVAKYKVRIAFLPVAPQRLLTTVQGCVQGS